MKDQAFLWSYDLTPAPTPLSRRHVISLSQSSCVPPVELNNERGWDVEGVGDKSYNQQLSQRSEGGQSRRTEFSPG
jgi:hypothetical protein